MEKNNNKNTQYNKNTILDDIKDYIDDFLFNLTEYIRFNFIKIFIIFIIIMFLFVITILRGDVLLRHRNIASYLMVIGLFNIFPYLIFGENQDNFVSRIIKYIKSIWVIPFYIGIVLFILLLFT